MANYNNLQTEEVYNLLPFLRWGTLIFSFPFIAAGAAIFLGSYIIDAAILCFASGLVLASLAFSLKITTNRFLLIITFLTLGIVGSLFIYACFKAAKYYIGIPLAIFMLLLLFKQYKAIVALYWYHKTIKSKCIWTNIVKLAFIDLFIIFAGLAAVILTAFMVDSLGAGKLILGITYEIAFLLVIIGINILLRKIHSKIPVSCHNIAEDMQIFA